MVGTPQATFLNWQGHNWYVDNAVRSINGSSNPNNFGRFTECVQVLPDGRLQLQIVNLGGTWYSAEFDQNDASLGYGRYRFVWSLTGAEPTSVVLGMFTYDTTDPAAGKRELDAEYTRFGDATRPAGTMYYSLQPTGVVDQHQTDFSVAGAVAPFTTDIVWQAGQVAYSTRDANGLLLGDHVVTDGVEVPGNEKVGLNLWYVSATPPTATVTAYINSFTFTPGITVTPTPAAVRYSNFTNAYGLSLNLGATATGGALTLPCVPGYSHGYTGSVFDMRNSSVDFAISSLPAVGTGTTESLVSLRFDASNYLMLLVSGGGYAARVRQGGVNTQIAIGAFNMALHKYGRITMSGTTATFYTSGDQVTWVSQGSLSCTIAASRLSALRLQMECGYYGTETAPGSFVLSSFGTTLGPNPNWPQVSVNYWPDDPPVSGVMPATTPTSILGRAKSFTTQRGRQYELAQDVAGTCTIVADNSDGALTGVPPMRPLQISALWGGQRYNIFTGYVERWPSLSADPTLAWSTISGADLFMPLAQRAVRPALQESILAAGPSDYFPMNDPVGAAAAGDLVPGARIPFAQYVVGPNSSWSGVSNFGAAALLPGDPSTSLAVHNSGARPDLGAIEVFGKRTTAYAVTMLFFQPWAATVTFATTSATGTAILWSALSSADDSISAQLAYDAGAGTLTFTVYDPSSTATTITVLNQWVHPLTVVFGYDGTSLFVRTSTKYALNYTATPPASVKGGAATIVRFGTAFNTAAVLTTQTVDFTMGHAAMWFATVPTYVQRTAIVAAGAGNTYETADQRITRLLGYFGVPLANLFPGISQLGAPTFSTTSSVLDAIRSTAMDDLGRLFVNKDGVVTFVSRRHEDSSLTPNAAGQVSFAPAYTFGSNTAAGELPYTGGVGWDFDASYVYNDVQVTPPQGSVQRAVDLPSQAKFFPRVLQVNQNLINTSDATDAANYLLNRYKAPVQRVQKITLDPGGNPSLWPAVLGLELGQFVMVNHRMMGAPTQSALCTVQKISHNVSSTGWTVDFELSPRLAAYWFLAALHTTLTGSSLAGATTLTLAPLPDSATNSAEASLAIGSTLTLDSDVPALAETVTITSVRSNPTAMTAGYTSVTVGVTATVRAHAAGATCGDALPTGYTNAAIYDPRSILDSTTVLSY
jgi:hypothetical protein